MSVKRQSVARISKTIRFELLLETRTIEFRVEQGRDNTCPAAGRLNRALPGIPW